MDDQPLLAASSSPKKTKPSAFFKCLFLIAVFLAAILCLIAGPHTVFFHGNTNLYSPFLDLPGHSVRTSPPTASMALTDILKDSIHSLHGHVAMANGLAHQAINGNNRREVQALADCLDLLDQTHGRLVDSLAAVAAPPTARSLADVQTWLSGALTNYVTCLDGLAGETALRVEDEVRASMGLLSSALAVLNDNRESMVEPRLEEDGKFPPWLSTADRRLLTGYWDKEEMADVVVATDGSGNYTTVAEAVSGAPKKSTRRYVIYIKNGTYEEQVSIPSSKTNITLVGDGMDSTIITGSLNLVDGSTTFNSATVAAVGDGFMARDIWFQNTAGPEKHQAVALRVGADLAVIYRCRIDGYQDTLYTHSQRQFYRDCSISGTVDYIFGNAAVVLQNCSLVSRLPLSNQKNTITAQGRTDPNQNTAISIQMCEVVACSDLEPVKDKIPTYLGRPWKNFSRTIFMESFLDDLIDSAGWLEWSGTFALVTLEYREYMNTGAGANTSERVTWMGYHNTTNATEAEAFTVSTLLQGTGWLESVGVAFTDGL